MQQVQLSDQLFQDAQQRALDSGFSSVDEYVAQLLVTDLHEESHDLLFTPERIADLDRISADLNAGGRTYSPDEMREHFLRKREAWTENPRS